MIISKGIGLKKILTWTGVYIVVLLTIMSSIVCLYYFKIIKFSIPMLPISIVGSAVAFYVGFKNNQAYDRMWEARKIWGGIVNDSRSWGMMVDGFITNFFADNKVSEEEIKQIKKRLIYRHIGWVYAHRSQLLIPSPWEHASQGGYVAKNANYYQQQFGVGLVDDQITKEELKYFLPDDEYERMINHKNTATQIINEQSRDLTKIRELGLIEDFRHIELANLLKEFYTHQGKNERIKKFPLPRQYANMSRYFVIIFMCLLPFGMIPEFIKLGDYALWFSIPICTLICWVYLMMEMIGDYTENPFQGMANDIPMLSLCRTIEIDLREMLKETELPKAIKAKKGILM